MDSGLTVLGSYDTSLQWPDRAKCLQDRLWVDGFQSGWSRYLETPCNKEVRDKAGVRAANTSIIMVPEAKEE
jgi:hypothetical protein